MIIRCSLAGKASFRLEKDRMIENVPQWPYYLYRSDLKRSLLDGRDYVPYGIEGVSQEESGILTHGRTQRNKLYIQIGCKRFVGENRRRLITWAKRGV